MKSCRECVHGVQADNDLIQCNYPVPIWISRELCSPSVGGALADQMYPWFHHNCPTYQPREERDTQP